MKETHYMYLLCKYRPLRCKYRLYVHYFDDTDLRSVSGLFFPRYTQQDLNCWVTVFMRWTVESRHQDYYPTHFEEWQDIIYVKFPIDSASHTTPLINDDHVGSIG